MYKKDYIYKFSFLPEDTIIHGISTKYYGVLKKGKKVHTKNLNKFLETLSLQNARTVLAGLVHGKNIAIIEDVVSHRIENTDGLITKKKNIFLWMGTADCLPLVIYDKTTHVIGIAHGGYRGILAGIVEEMIKMLVEIGSKIEDIQVGIGPGIGICCYNVSKERIELFQERYGKDAIFEERGKKYYLDLTGTVKKILVSKGIRQENIEDADICTKDHQDEFYSHRGTGKWLHDNFVTIIGRI